MGPFVGTTFEVERQSDRASVAVFEADGAPARFGVAAQIAGLYRHFGRTSDPAASKLPAGSQKIGQSSPDAAELLVTEISRGVSITHVEVRASTLSEIRPAANGALHGLYDVEVEVIGASEGSLVTMNLKGTLLLRDVDGALLEVRLQGPIKSGPEPDDDGAVDPETPVGTGELKMTVTMVYAQA